jgi:hypothetical protein
MKDVHKRIGVLRSVILGRVRVLCVLPSFKLEALYESRVVIRLSPVEVMAQKIPGCLSY